VAAPEKSLINNPDLKVYVAGFGTQKDDCCVVAEADNKIIGATWVRIMNDYGHIDDETPSLAISLYKQYPGLHRRKRPLNELWLLLNGIQAGGGVIRSALRNVRYAHVYARCGGRKERGPTVNSNRLKPGNSRMAPSGRLHKTQTGIGAHEYRNDATQNTPPPAANV
jgi:hypothetical protein